MLESKEGIFISMEDLDGLHVWTFKYRFVIRQKDAFEEIKENNIVICMLYYFVFRITVPLIA